jgi:hypothetical protein
MSKCTCDYSYTCPTCQDRIEAERLIRLNEAKIEWVFNAIKEIAKKLDIVLPEFPNNDRGW